MLLPQALPVLIRRPPPPPVPYYPMPPTPSNPLSPFIPAWAFWTFPVALPVHHNFRFGSPSTAYTDPVINCLPPPPPPPSPTTLCPRLPPTPFPLSSRPGPSEPFQWPSLSSTTSVSVPRPPPTLILSLTVSPMLLPSVIRPPDKCRPPGLFIPSEFYTPPALNYPPAPST